MMTNFTIKRFTGSIACRDCVNKKVSTSEDKLVVLTTGFLFDMISPQYLPEPKLVIEVGKSFQSFSFRQLLQDQKCTETTLQHQRENLCSAAVLIFHNQERNKHSIRYSSRLINSFNLYIRTFLYQFSLKY